jgi:hypothetical protein
LKSQLPAKGNTDMTLKIEGLMRAVETLREDIALKCQQNKILEDQVAMVGNVLLL